MYEESRVVIGVLELRISEDHKRVRHVENVEMRDEGRVFFDRVRCNRHRRDYWFENVTC